MIIHLTGLRMWAVNKVMLLGIQAGVRMCIIWNVILAAEGLGDVQIRLENKTEGFARGGFFRYGETIPGFVFLKANSQVLLNLQSFMERPPAFYDANNGFLTKPDYFGLPF